jgi:hypothetical protein
MIDITRRIVSSRSIANHGIRGCNTILGCRFRYAPWRTLSLNAAISWVRASLRDNSIGSAILFPTGRHSSYNSQRHCWLKFGVRLLGRRTPPLLFRNKTTAFTPWPRDRRIPRLLLRECPLRTSLSSRTSCPFYQSKPWFRRPLPRKGLVIWTTKELCKLSFYWAEMAQFFCCPKESAGRIFNNASSDIRKGYVYSEDLTE